MKVMGRTMCMVQIKIKDKNSGKEKRDGEPSDMGNVSNNKGKLCRKDQ